MNIQSPERWTDIISGNDGIVRGFWFPILSPLILYEHLKYYCITFITSKPTKETKWFWILRSET